ncbi:hypothetical protein D1614_19595 [Maribellus luteus]|uniref:Bacteriocin n=1 Tax=Maribellus luteus TaxID=2305463 RepID=A0A399SSA3_9BACT|nr:hypothetical protein [Maribellus luteus]RIJ46178.1 hypothetical protein D1614_19595 [Maribellus luteus]
MIEMIDLTKNEVQNINGGAPAWNWTGKILGAIAEVIADWEDSLQSPEGQAMYNALQDFH